MAAADGVAARWRSLPTMRTENEIASLARALLPEVVFMDRLSSGQAKSVICDGTAEYCGTTVMLDIDH